MIAFVLCSIIAGLLAAAFALASGASLIIAALVYASAGFLTITAVLLRALVCEYLKDSRGVLAQTP